MPSAAEHLQIYSHWTTTYCNVAFIGITNQCMMTYRLLPWLDSYNPITSSLCVSSVLETKTETLGPGFSSYKIRDLLYGRTYIFTIRPLYGEMEGPISTVFQRIGKTLLKWFDLLCETSILHSYAYWLHRIYIPFEQYQYFVMNIVCIAYYPVWVLVTCLFIPVGQDPPAVTVQPVPATAAPPITTASITNTRVPHAVTRTTRHPIAAPPTKSMTTEKPPDQPSVSVAKAAEVPSVPSTTPRAAPPKHGIAYS